MGYTRISILTIFIISLGLFFNAPDAFATIWDVSIPSGTSAPGCETSNACFIPYSITIHPGEDVTWTNDDSAAHTVTSGVNTPDGNFDSSLFMAGATFSVTFDDEGYFPYYCVVHPWMLGEVNVEYEVAYAPAPVPEAPDEQEYEVAEGQAQVPEAPEVVEDAPQVPDASESKWQSLFYEKHERVLELEGEKSILANEIVELEGQKNALEENMLELQEKIKNLEALAREQLKVIYEWVVGK